MNNLSSGSLSTDPSGRGVITSNENSSRFYGMGGRINFGQGSFDWKLEVIVILIQCIIMHYLDLA